MSEWCLVVPGQGGWVPLPVVEKKKAVFRGYTPTDRIPIAFQGKGFKFRMVDGKMVLHSVVTGLPVLKRTVQREKKNVGQCLRGQDFYKGFGSPLERAKLVAAYKNVLRPYVEKRLVLQRLPSFPWHVRVELHCSKRRADWDVDNYWILTKCFLDLLQSMGILPNDNIQYVTAAGEIRWVPSVTEETRFIISTDAKHPPAK